MVDGTSFFIREPEDKLLNLHLSKARQQSANTLCEAIADVNNRDAELRLRQRIKEHLERSVGTPQFLVLTKPMLLVRYQIGLSPSTRLSC